MRLAIGTAQFGSNYGLSNNLGKVVQSEANSILRIAKNSKIEFLDTAMSYGDSENIIGNSGITDFKIVSKLTTLSEHNEDVRGHIFNKINDSLSHLRVNSLYGILLHQVSDLHGKNGSFIYESLLELKKKGLVKKIGLSIYNVDELADIIPKFKFDIVQCPLNIFDRRLVSSGWLKKLKELGIEVHARSIFLQGLLLMNASKRPDYFNPWSNLLNNYDQWLKEANISNLEACISFISNINSVDKIIVGIDSSSQLKEIINLFYADNIKIPQNLFSEDQLLINPSKWSI
jgi:aryl-alcohol dehydrogenase-like predicted oxidoreductase